MKTRSLTAMGVAVLLLVATPLASACGLSCALPELRHECPGPEPTAHAAAHPPGREEAGEDCHAVAAEQHRAGAQSSQEEGIALSACLAQPCPGASAAEAAASGPERAPLAGARQLAAGKLGVAHATSFRFVASRSSLPPEGDPAVSFRLVLRI